MMLLLPDKNFAAEQEKIFLLEKEIALLEAEILVLETAVNSFQTKIRTALSSQIRRIHYLTEIYKNQKQAKKQKRQEQKKRGKNYKEPVGLKITNISSVNKNYTAEDKKQEIRRLYKESIVKVHPDKIVSDDDELQRNATDITSQLNEFYKNGNLDELTRLHEHIISGNALAYKSHQPETVNDFPAMMLFLQQKKRKLEMLLQEIKASGIYEFWQRESDFDFLVRELKLQFEERITVLEKRTK
ncbi:MAG: hypothetical protein ACRYFL_10400 [Janthinobacterium lividum]